MRNTLLLVAFFFLYIGQLAAKQSGLVLFSDNGKKFKVYTNGALQNNEFMSEVRICCFLKEDVAVKIEFEDKTSFEKHMVLRRGFMEHDRVTKNSIVFDSYERIPDEYLSREKPSLIIEDRIEIASKRKECTKPMSSIDFFDFYSHLKEHEGFDADKLIEAKDAVFSNCFTAKHVKITMSAFSYESTRLAFAKFAYDYVYDKDNYGIVKGGLRKDESGYELDEYIKNRP